MKIRNGFISNSSSSSFIINFEKVPESEKELQTILFGLRKEYHDPYSLEFYSTNLIAKKIWNKFSNISPTTKEKITETLKNGYPCIEQWLENTLKIKYPTISYVGNKTNWDKYQEDLNRYVNQFMYMFDDNKEYYILEFSDNDTNLDGAIEHGNALNNITKIKISHH